jgi:two-component system, OmpR family, sensor kinase
VGHNGFRVGQAGPRPRSRVSLEVRFAATSLCLLAAGAAIITGVCGVMARGYLQRQADRQLRACAGRLISHPFEASPLYGVAGGVPGAAALGGGLSIEVRGSAGQVVMRAGPAGRPGPVMPGVPAAVAARAGQPATVAAGGGGSWRVITEPIRYRARRIPFSYSTEGFYLVITSTARQGHAGTLAIGLDLRSASQAIGGLAVTGLAIGGVVILTVTCLAVAVSRAILRPVTQAEQALTALAAGQLSHRVAERHGGDASRLAASLTAMLSQIEDAFRTRAASEAAACRSRGQMCRIIADTGHRLRKPLSIVHGIADCYWRADQLSPGELDRMVRRVADEAARMDALLDELLLAQGDQPPPQRLLGQLGPARPSCPPW